jgi:DNA-binding LacI/PurR family transcriptional regulator
MTRQNGQPIITINRAETELDSVRCDDRGGAKQAFQALRATGASRLAVINAARPSPSLLAREQAFSKLAEAIGAGLAVFRAGRADYEGGHEAARRLLAEAHPLPEGLFCVNDLMAFGALDNLRGSGIGVPGDLSVVGFDDVPMAAWAPYRLTTLRQDPARIAEKVIALLDRRAEEPESPPMAATFKVDLIVRETVRGPK